MKKYIVIILFPFFFGKGRAQQLVNAAGTYTTAGGIQLEWSLGEPRTLSTASYAWFTEGVLQPNAGITNQPPDYSSLPTLSGAGIDNAGTTFLNSGNNLMLEFTTGETASKTLVANIPPYMATQGILQPYITTITLPVTGLNFTAKRLNGKEVLLDWKTTQESNNRGFAVERRHHHEPVFIRQQFVPSKAPNGNNSFPTDYQLTDTNSYTGTTYYRLRQEDKNGSATYSVVRLVTGDESRAVALKAWPIPATGPVFVQVNGAAKEVLLVYDNSGRLVKQLSVTNNQVVQLNGLPAGAYLLRLKSQTDITQKIVIQ